MRLIQVLRAIRLGLTPSEVKARVGLSRYSYLYVVNRLMNNELLESHGERLVVSRRGLNVLNLDDENERVKEERVALEALVS